MGYLDLFFSLIIAWGAYSGFSKGVLKELASIIGVVVGIFLVKNYYQYLDLKLKPIFESDTILISFLSALLIFLITIILSKIIAKLLTKVLKIIALGLLNRIIGSFFGMIKTVLLLCIMVFIFSNLNKVIEIAEREQLNESFFYTKIEKINGFILEINYDKNGNEE
tara:strand:- start:261 stop:758 length:498 start_codon:yes stop_codon:yes gene_type:complete